MDYTYIPYYSLKPNAITLFEKPEERIISIRQRETFNNLKDNTNKYGEISEHAQKRLRKMIDFMLYITREKQQNAYRDWEICIETNASTVCIGFYFCHYCRRIKS